MGTLAVATSEGIAGPPVTDDLRFEAVFRMARDPLVALIRRVLDHGEAEDVAQEAFVKLRADPVLARPDPEVTAWLRRVGLNLAFNRARDVNRWRERGEKAQGPALAPDPAEEAVRTDQRQRVRDVLALLPATQRDCLLLRHAGYSYAEIAETLTIAKGSVGTTLVRAERAFKEHYLDEENRS